MRRLTALLGLLLAAQMGGALDGLAASKTNDRSRHLDPTTAVELSQAAIGGRLSDHRFVDADDNPVSMAELRGKPLVVSIVYTGCATVCPPMTKHLATAISEAQKVLGSDRFTVLTLGFDATHDSPSRMAGFARDRNIDVDNWRFVSGDRHTIEAMLEELGFAYAAVAGGFDHIAQTTIVDTDGVVYRQVYGDDFPIQVFMEPLKDVVFGTQRPLSVEGLLDRFRYFCTSFDPSAGRYTTRFAETIAGIVLGGLSLIGAGLLIRREWKKSSAA